MIVSTSLSSLPFQPHPILPTGVQTALPSTMGAQILLAMVLPVQALASTPQPPSPKAVTADFLARSQAKEALALELYAAIRLTLLPEAGRLRRLRVPNNVFGDKSNVKSNVN